MSDILTDKQIAQALEHARELIRIGLAVFIGNPCARDCEKHPDGKGLHLPQKWQNTVPDLSVVDSWKEHQYLCAIGGSVVDFLDVDPRNGGEESEAGLLRAGMLPISYGKQLTPSGGHHYLIAPLGCGKGTPAPGIDLQGGRPGGQSAGFVFLSPTRRCSKTDAVIRSYMWGVPPDIERITAEASSDDSGHAIADMISRPKTSADKPAGEDRIFTRDEAKAFCQPHINALAAATTGTINDKLNTAAKALSHFGEQFWPQAHGILKLHEAISRTAYDGATWNAADTINSAYASAGNDWIAVLKEQPTPPDDGEPITDADRAAFVLEEEIKKETRRQYVHHEARERVKTWGPQKPPKQRKIDLQEYLDGTHSPAIPSVGAIRDDNRQLLYPGWWHSMIGLTTSGKSWFALWHALAEMRAGNHVAYAHFEEISPSITIGRLRALACDDELILNNFTWLDCSTNWAPQEMAHNLPEQATLLILDGINAACSQHGWPVNLPEGVGAYRQTLVTPAAVNNTTVLSLGHPVKNRDRQEERHGYGCTAWLDEQEGVAFRLEASQKTPIRRGNIGYSALYSVKDREGQVQQLGQIQDQRESGWNYLGSFIIDNTPEGTNTIARLSIPANNNDEEKAQETLRPGIDIPLMRSIIAILKTKNDLTMRDIRSRVSGRHHSVSEALAWLEDNHHIEVFPGPNRSRLHRYLSDPDAT